MLVPGKARVVVLLGSIGGVECFVEGVLVDGVVCGVALGFAVYVVEEVHCWWLIWSGSFFGGWTPLGNDQRRQLALFLISCMKAVKAVTFLEGTLLAFMWLEA